MSAKVSRKVVCLGVAAFLSVYGLLWWAASSQRERLPDFSQYVTAEERKAAFTGFLAPLINNVQAEILSERRSVLDIEQAFKDNGNLNEMQWFQLRQLSGKYLRIENPDRADSAELIADLRLRVDIIPTDLTLAQAALESGWGSSYFARQGNNLFGMRCFRPGCGMRPRWSLVQLPYGYSRYASPRESIEAYMLNLNRHEAYQDLRRERSLQRARGTWPNSRTLSGTLDNYAEDPNYIRSIRRILNDNPEWTELMAIGHDPD
ncbi:MAG: glucosaminidase domain-containing protein [Opitutales bacterium]|nr:glucosaminidase domain-containing protein [Opitutales bacterium]